VILNKFYLTSDSYGQQMTDSSSLYSAEKSLLSIQITSLEREKAQVESQNKSKTQEIEQLTSVCIMNAIIIDQDRT
jgi:hypothetical protein